MSMQGGRRGRRGRAFAVGGLAVVLGGVAASDMAGRERALRAQLGPSVPVLVARVLIPAGTPVRQRDLAVRRVPARYAPVGALQRASDTRGLRAQVALPAGLALTEAVVGRREVQVTPSAPVRVGERVADVVAAGTVELIVPGSRVDVLVTREKRDDTPGGTVLALESVEVLAASPAQAAAGPVGESAADAAPQTVRASLRVTLRQAVYLAAAQSFASEIRLLARPSGDGRRVRTPVSVDPSLEE